MTGKLPPVQEDPLLIAARESGVKFDRDVDKIRRDPMESELSRASKIHRLWEDYQAGLAHSRETFYAQRLKRLEELERTVPIGPGITPDTSPADAAALHQAFVAQYDSAMLATTSELMDRYQRARRFGDDLGQRAILTAASDKGAMGVVSEWASEDPVRQQQLTEAAELRDLVQGHGTMSRFVGQALGQFLPRQRPQESQSIDAVRQRYGVTEPTTTGVAQ